MHPIICDSYIIADRHEGGITKKCLLMDEKNYILFSYNTEEYNPVIIPSAAPNPIIGKVAWWGKGK